MAAFADPAAARTISWSGYEWDVRPAGFGPPGSNHWSDSEANVRVEGTELALSIVKDAQGRWTSAEIDNRRSLGYGTYRWVVASDLSALDAHEVLGMFTYGGADPSNNEIDIEPSHWGNLAWPTGSATVWQDAAAGRNQSRTFEYSSRPPYVNQFTWEPGRIAYVVTDAAGATLLRWTVTGGVPTPAGEVPIVNYWRFENAPPAGTRSMRLSSFAWVPLGQEGALPEPPRSAASPPAAASGPGEPCPAVADDTSATRRPRVRVRVRPKRFPISRARRAPTIRWTATGRVRLRLVVERRVRERFVAVASVKRWLRRGSGRIRLARRVGGRGLRPGRYRVVVARLGAKGRASCVSDRLPFTVRAS